MSANTAELTLLIKAKNLVDLEIDKVKASMTKLTVTAKTVARDMSDAFKSVGRRIGNQLANVATDILTGGNLQQSLLYVGATMAGAVVEGLSAHFIPMVLEKVMSTAAFAPLAAAMSAGGATLGSVLATAIAVGAAAFPFILAALAIAALVYVATNPEFRAKAKAVALEIIGKIGDGLRALPGFLADIFGKALNAVLDIARKIVSKIVDAILAIPRAVAAALKSLGVLKSHTAQQNIDYHTQGVVPGHAQGGWVGRNGPELAWVGEKGPEYIVPNNKLSSMGGDGGLRIVGVSKRDMARIIDEQMYVLIQRAVPTLDRR